MADITSIYGNPIKDAVARQDIATNTQDITDLKSELTATTNALATDTASGVIASFPDGADGVPVKSLTVAIEPVQDLHGQANPYPAGGGKNLLPITITGETTVNGLKRTPVFDADGNLQYILLNGDCTAQSDIIISGTWGSSDTLFTLPAGTYTFSKGVNNSNFAFIMRVGSTNIISTYSTPYNFTLNANTNVSFCFFRCSAGQYDNVKVYPQIEVGSSASAYAPYSNICPISGYTWAKVAHSDIQLFNPSATEIGKNWTGGAASNRAINRTAVEGGKRYRVKRNGDSLAFGMVQLLQMNGGNNLNATITIGYNYDGYVDALSNCTHFLFQYSKDTDISAVDFKEEILSVSKNYCNIYSIDWTTEAGTVYGGTLDATTGVLTVTHGAKVFYGSETWETEHSDNFFTDVISDSERTSHVQCSICPSIYTSYAAGLLNCWISGSGRFNITIPSIAHTVPAIKSLLSNTPATIVYELATPFTVQLTAEEVTTLKGQNNIWADCGDTTVEYRADTKLYIEKLTAPTEDDMIADHAISANTFFMVGNTLYRATTAIASGATITVGTNATRLSLSDALNTLS